jgi:integrase
MTKLTKRIVETTKADPTKDTFLWCDELKGFGVKVTRSGTKTFVLQYRNSENRSRRMVLGRYGAFSVEDARRWAMEKMVEVYKGDDPLQEKQSKREGLTVADLCDWYLTEARAGRILGRMRRPIKPSTLDMDESRIKTHILPLLGTRKIEGLRRGDIEKLQADIIAGKTAKGREGRGGHTTGGPGVGARAVGTIHSIFEHAIRFDMVERNPARGVRRHADNKKQRRLSSEEIIAFGKALRAAEGIEHPVALEAIRFALLTGFRRLEVLSLEHKWVDHDSRVIRFPQTKTGAQVRVIGSAALATIRNIRSTTESAYVFEGAIGDGHFVGVPRVLGRITAELGWNDVTMHVLRHTFASVAGDLGYSELTIRAMLGHASRGVTQRYVHIDDPLRAAADKTCERIADLLATRSRYQR